MHMVKGDGIHVMQEGGQTTKPLSQVPAGRDLGNLQSVENLGGHGKDDGRVSFRNNQQESFLFD